MLGVFLPCVTKKGAGIMRFWWRELVGWVLLLLGLGGIGLCVWALLLDPPDYVVAFLLTLPAVMVFRGGLHLLKVAVAARVALHAHTEDAKPARARPPAKPHATHDW
jgi:hypothetical protein